MVPDILVQATHQFDKLRKSNESTQVKSTQEHLEEAFEEQVRLDDYVKS